MPTSSRDFFFSLVCLFVCLGLGNVGGDEVGEMVGGGMG